MSTSLVPQSGKNVFVFLFQFWLALGLWAVLGLLTQAEGEVKPSGRCTKQKPSTSSCEKGRHADISKARETKLNGISVQFEHVF